MSKSCRCIGVASGLNLMRTLNELMKHKENNWIGLIDGDELILKIMIGGIFTELQNNGGGGTQVPHESVPLAGTYA